MRTPRQRLCHRDPLLGYHGALSGDRKRGAERAWKDYQAGDFGEAEEHWRAIEGGGDFYPATLGLAQVALARGDAERAREIVAPVVREHPRYVAALLALACAEEEMKEFRHALGHFDAAAAIIRETAITEHAEELAGVAVRSLMRGARSAESAGDLEDARAILLELTAIAPQLSEAHLAMGRLLLRLGENEPAREALRRAVGLEPENTAARQSLAEVEEVLGNFSAAVAIYQALVLEEPGHAGHAEALARVREAWNFTNMPAEFRAALESAALTRRELATLLWWKVPEVRVSRGNIGQIAIDIHDIPERDAVIRALALGLMNVEEDNHSFYPDRAVTRLELARTLERLLGLFLRSQSPPKCLTAAREPQIQDLPPGSLYSTVAKLVACRILELSSKGQFFPAASATGASAGEALEQLRRIF